MMLELFIFFEVVVIGLFLAAFFTKQEILWGIMNIFSAILMFSSYSIEMGGYIFNSSMSAYQPIIISYNYPYLSGINLLFFVVGLILMMFDIFEKYGNRTFNFRKGGDNEDY